LYIAVILLQGAKLCRALALLLLPVIAVGHLDELSAGVVSILIA
jgi:hypothetical protein